MIRPQASKQGKNSVYSPRTPRKSDSGRFFNTKRSKTPELLFDTADIFAVDVSDELIVFGNEMGMVECFLKNDLERISTFNYAPSRGENIMSLKFINGNRLVAGDTLGNVVIYDTNYQNLQSSRTNTISPLNVLDHDQSIGSKSQLSVNCLDFNGTNTICGVFSDKSIRLYDSNSNFLTNKVEQSIDIGDGSISHLNGHTKQPHCCKFLDSDIFVTSGWDDCLKIWDRRAPQLAVLSISQTYERDSQILVS